VRTAVEESLELDDVRSKAIAGVVNVGVRNIIVRITGLVGTVILARLLEPRDFGLLALGLTLQLLGNVLASGGLGADLIRRADPPTRPELRSVLGFQLVAATVIALGVGVVCWIIGGSAGVVALIALSLPVAVLTTPSRVLLERSLDWTLLARIEIAATLAFNVCAVGLAATTLGVWGVAIAAVFEAVVVTILLLGYGPVGILRPQLSIPLVRPLLRFGLAYQSVALIDRGRDQALNTLIAIVAGITTLGIWSAAYRVFLGITLLVDALWRVSFPAMARMLELGQEAQTMVTAALRLNAIALGALAVLVGGTAPALVPTLFGPTFDDAIKVLPWGAAALLLTGPVATAAVSFIQAMGDGGRLIKIIGAQSIVWLAAAAVLVAPFGAEGAGMAMLVGAISLTWATSRAVSHYVSVQIFDALWAPVLAAAAGGTLGWLLAERIDPAIVALPISGACCEIVYFGLMFVLRRADLLRLLRTFSAATQNAFPAVGRFLPSRQTAA
jgi:O-antigen/teichoic acid export membrane protein